MVVVNKEEEVNAVDPLLVAVVGDVLLKISVVDVLTGAIVVCIKQRLSTTTASTGQQGEPPHCMDSSVGNFVHVPMFGAAFTMSCL